MSPAIETDGLFSEDYGNLLAPDLSVGEPDVGRYTSPALEVGEKLVRCLWFDQFVDADALHAEDGRKLAILSPGFWNEADGPDFRNAEIRLGNGPAMRGDVEIHLLSSDYARHRHGGDPAYDGVVLHVVFHNDLGTVHLETAGRRVPQLALDRHLTADLAEVLAALDLDLPRAVMPGNTGPCCAALGRHQRNEAWLGRFLDLAGDARVLGKARRYATSLTNSTPDQCLYSGLMDALGYKGNRRPFRRLAECIPVADLRRLVPEDGDVERRIRVAESLLFGVAGLLPSPKEGQEWDQETCTHVEALRAVWHTVEAEFGERRVDRPTWQFGKTRPVNYPPRRIAAAAHLVARHVHSGICRTLVEAFERCAGETRAERRSRSALRNVREMFLDARDSYWATRCNFGSRRFGRPTRLLGPERTLAMMVNVIVPAMVAVARAENRTSLERLLHGIYASLGRMSENSVTRYMESRLFADSRAARRVVTNARRQQGLFQLYHDFCESHQTTCDRCAFLALAEQETVTC